MKYTGCLTENNCDRHHCLVVGVSNWTRKANVWCSYIRYQETKGAEEEEGGGGGGGEYYQVETGLQIRKTSTKSDQRRRGQLP